MFCCNNCEKSFKTNWQLQRHLSKKRTCKKLLPNETQEIQKETQEIQKETQETQEIQKETSRNRCEFCLGTYNTNLKRHVKNCKMKDDHIRCMEIELDKHILPWGSKTCRFCSYVTRTPNIKRHLKSCKAKEEYQKRLEAELQAQKAHNNNVTVINNNTNISNNTVNNDNKTINNNINVHINPIGQENVSYMTFAVIKNLMRQSHSGEAFMANTLAYIHAHEDHPENHNIIVSNHRSNLALVKRSDKFEYENINTVMRETSNSWLDKVCLDEDYEELPKKIKQKYEGVCENDELDTKAASIFKSQLYAKHKDGVITKPCLKVST